MNKTTRPHSLTARASTLALILAAFPFHVDAASLGRLSVWSGLGQPLRAEVEVSATPEELTTLIARVATPDMYRQAGLQYTSAISGLQITVDRRGSRPVVRVSSDRPMNEAFVDLLLELSWANGRLSREYTLLLDPVELPGGGRGAPVAPPVALPEARISQNLAQRGASLPPPGPVGLPPLPEVGQKSPPVQPRALPSLKPSYAAPSDARLSPSLGAASNKTAPAAGQIAAAPAPAPAPAAPAPAPAPAPASIAAAPAPGLDPRLSAPRAKPAADAASAPQPDAPALSLKQSVDARLGKPEPKPETKVLARVEPKPEPKPELKPEPKPEPKAEPKVAAKAEPKAETRSASVSSAKLEPKPQAEPAADARQQAKADKKLSRKEKQEIAAREAKARAAEKAAEKAAEAQQAAKVAKLEAELRAQERERLKEGRAAAPAAEASAAGTSPNTYTVQRGDTLYKIARETKPEEVSLEQMLVALFRNNESAFEGNMNRLKSGRIIDLPAPEVVAETPKNVARREVIAQSADFDAYRAKLAELAKAAPAREDNAQQSAAGKISPRVEETRPAPASKDQLRLARSSSGKGSKGDGKEAERRIAAGDDAAARERALKDANTRVTELEQNVKNLQALIELKSRSLAELQRRAQGGAASASASPADPSSAKADAARAPTDPASGLSAEVTAESTRTAQATGSQTPADPAAKSAGAPASSPVPRESRAAKGGAERGAEEVLAVLAKPAVWGSAAGLAALLAGFFGFSLLRSRRPIETVRPIELEPKDDLETRIRTAREALLELRSDDNAERRPQPDSEVGRVDGGPSDYAGAGLSVETAASAPASDVEVQAPSALQSAVIVEPAVEIAAPVVPAAELVSPVAPASALNSQEPALVEAIPVSAPAQSPEVAPAGVTLELAAPIDPQPAPAAEEAAAAPASSDHAAERSGLAGRAAIHLELLRLYAERKEYEQFDALANELHRLTGGEGLEWREAASLGRRIDPGNSLYVDVLHPARHGAAAVSKAMEAGIEGWSSAGAEKAAARAAETPAASAAAPRAPEAVSSVPPAPASLEGVDFDLGEFSSSATPPANADVTAVKAEASSAAPAPAVVEPPKVAASGAPSAPLGSLAEPVAVAAPLDLGGITLDLDPAAPADPPRIDEIDAKLELARAYLEMGDKPGARELLNEALQEGSPAQQEAARLALSKLG